MGLFSEENISNGVDKVKKKRISGEANDVDKQMIYTASKSTNKSKVQYSPNPHGAFSQQSEYTYI